MRTTANFNKMNNKFVVLLIGVSQYTNDARLNDIPNVETNIEELRKLFLDKRYINVNEKNIIVSFNETSKAIMKKVSDASDMAKNSDYTLFVYYSGHGVISPSNYNLYFATSDMEDKYLEISAVNAKEMLDTINHSMASRKIMVVDACHSGQIHNTMGDGKSTVANLMKNYEGVHYVSACDESSSALFPKNKPNAPTYFTGALISRVHSGMDIDRPYLTLREIVDDITYDFKTRKNMPIPQQSSVLSADQMPFVVNVIDKDFSDYEFSMPESKSVADDNESAWQKTVKANSLAAYYEYIEKYPKSSCAKLAENKIHELEEEDKWIKTVNLGTLIAYNSYKKAYPMGKYIGEANKNISIICNLKKDNDMWNNVVEYDSVAKYNEYICAFPKGAHVMEANYRIKELADKHVNFNKFVFLTLGIMVAFMLVFTHNLNPKHDSQESYVPVKIQSDTVKKFASKNLDDNFTSSNYLEKSDEQKADELLSKNMEEYLPTALTLLNNALSEDPDNEDIKRKINDLNNKIDVLVEGYLDDAEMFSKSAVGMENAKNCAERALRLRPDNAKANDLMLKFNNK